MGIVKKCSGIACVALKNLDVDLGKVLQKCEQRLKRIKIIGKEDNAKGVIDSAYEEARALNYNYVGTEHLLLGILCQEKSKGAQILRKLGLKVKDVRAEVINLSGKKGEETIKGKIKTLPKKREKAVKCKIFELTTNQAIKDGIEDFFANGNKEFIQAVLLQSHRCVLILYR